MLEFLILCGIEMGTQVFNDEADTDTESIINYTRQPKKAPPYVPRSRSLGDLPGGIRVPIIKKQESRLQQKHEANMAGLEELKMLRQKHGQMVDDIRTTLTPPETNQRRSSPTKLSSSSLASIQEETIYHNGVHDNDNITDVHKSKSRFSISSDESQIESSINSKCSSGSSSIESLSQSEDQPEAPDRRTREQILADFQRNFEQNYGRQKGLLTRRVSVQVETLSNRTAPPIDRTIRPKLRRASFQCEAVMTKTSEREEPVSKVISDIKLQYNFPSPLHAITRQYGSSSDVRTKVKEEQLQSAERNFKSILEEWQNEKPVQKNIILSTNVPINDRQSKKDQTGSNIETDDICHVRNLSFTSDYFGSTETLNTINTCPIPSTVNDQRQTKRRQSLPTKLTANDFPPKLPERRRSLIDNSNKNKRDQFTLKDSESNKHKYIASESDDGIFYEEDDLLQNSNNKWNQEIVKMLPKNELSMLDKNGTEEADNITIEEKHSIQNSTNVKLSLNKSTKDKQSKVKKPNETTGCKPPRVALETAL